MTVHSMPMNCQSTPSLQSLSEYDFRIVADERCSVVGFLASIVRWWDKGRHLNFIDRRSNRPEDLTLLKQLDASHWSLLLFDDVNERWDGPDAIPILLKNLPGGKIAAVLYILPGTMWLTKQLYLLVSRNHKRVIQNPRPS